MSAIISVNNISKTYRVPQREPGLQAALRSLISPSFQEVPAVKSISFSIQPGEIVALIGPNGAGKTTTIKMLTGLLQPTDGEILVNGFIPGKRSHDFLSQISIVLGNKSQMLWDIPPLDTFQVLGEIYRIPKDTLQQRIDEMVALLDMSEILRKPVRNLSLGERMKCELVASLLHQPKVLFLDEPTLGLDISIQNRLRKFILEYNHKYNATILLTSHYMTDIERLCQRVILIHHGEILYDGARNGLSSLLTNNKIIHLTLRDHQTENQSTEWLPEGAEMIEHNHHNFTLRVNREHTARIIADLLKKLPITDLSIEEPALEAVIDRVYQDGAL
ncbi:MAG TPA: ATP-binding cassette domain-containing protein [Anaerolineaceae bacterium]|nr:ATP-binding cassette domain-containing protein [Anaerolineaceae bacterium]